ncbi:MAG TPA: trypsin-like peptidase domain-containing protein, partial [Stellaceae bacterium]|nr:trypsin-like peptidase domain-containing protein [Stellaceae bacterium]
MSSPFTSRRPAASRLRPSLLAASTALALAFGPMALADAPPASQIVQLPTLAPLVKKVLPAVVNVSVTVKAGADTDSDDEDQDQDQDNGGGDQDQMGPPQGGGQSPFDDLLRRFFEQRRGQMAPAPHEQHLALGSGFIIDPKGYIVTNNHVVENADKVTVIFQDDTKHAAKVIGRDVKTDLALL